MGAILYYHCEIGCSAGGIHDSDCEVAVGGWVVMCYSHSGNHGVEWEPYIMIIWGNQVVVWVAYIILLA